MKYKITIWLLFSFSLEATTFSYSQMAIPVASITTLVSTNMNTEIAAIKALNLFYKNNIIKENDRKRRNIEKLIKLNTKEALLVGEIITLDKKIKKVLEMARE
jgi:hypothetical protein